MDSLTDGLNRSCIGRTYQGPTLRVDAETMRAFARGAADSNPRYSGDDPVAHPLLAVRLLRGLMPAVLGDPELNCDQSRLVHGEQLFEYRRPIRADDSVQLRGEILAVEDKRSGQLLRVGQQLLVDGTLVVEGRSTAFIRALAPPPANTAGQTDEGSKRGDLLFTEATEVTSEHAQCYAEASGDHNPIHLDRSAARAAGFDDVILHGTCTLAFALRAVVNGVLDGDPERLKSVSVRFSGPVIAGDTVTTYVRDAGPGRFLFESRNSDGILLLSRGSVEC